MSRYTGLDEELRFSVATRDRWRCRWCGATNRHIDIHHIRYRRSDRDDVPENLICLCREDHDYVHGLKTPTIPKTTAQEVLRELIGTPGVTGIQLMRWHEHDRQVS